MDYKDILLVSEDYIKTFTNANDNISGDYILPAIYFAQRQYLEECLGTALVRKIQGLIAMGEIENEENKPYKELLDDYIQDYLAFTALSEIIINTSFKINNFGASRTEDEKQYGVSFSEVYKLRDYYKSKADYLQYRMQRFLIANYGNYPELVEYKTVADLQVNLYSAGGSNIWLGGARNPKRYQKPSLKDIYNFPSSDNKKKGGR